MNKKVLLDWNRLVSYINENYTDNQCITQNMIHEIKALQEYIESMFASDEKMNYAELLQIFKQSKGIVDETIRGKLYRSNDERFAEVCKGVRKYIQMIMGVSDECRVHQYYDKPASISANISVTIPKEVGDTYNSKLDEIKKREDVNKYREFTRIGAFSTYILAVAKGLIDFRKCGEQIYLIAKDGCLGSEHEIDSLSQ